VVSAVAGSNPVVHPHDLNESGSISLLHSSCSWSGGDLLIQIGMPMLIVDAHLDLSLNATVWERDLTLPASEIRAAEQQMTDFKFRGTGTVSLAELQRGEVGLCVATLFARCAAPDEDAGKLATYSSPEAAWDETQRQLGWYREMESRGWMVQIVDRTGLDQHVARCLNGEVGDIPIGYVLSLEGADSIVTPGHLERSYDQGLRAIGPGHYGKGRYGGGTADDSGLNAAGRELLAEMERLGIILDSTHLSEPSFWEALDVFGGPVWASHNNCRALVPGDRQFSDDQLRALISRGAVIGTAFDAWMLTPNWQKGVSRPESSGVTLDSVADHIDHVCQVAGNARHAAIGTDLDGGFGREQSPADVDTIADLQRLPGILAGRGYSEADVRDIMHGNWLRFLRNAWS
jgi:membrane dipeptidase